MIWGVLLPQNRVWNSTHILKKSKYIFHKNTYIFPWGTRTAITLIMTYIYLWGPLGSDLLQLKNGIWNPTYILKKSKYIPHKNTHIFSKENQNPNRLYHDLYFNLGTLRKWFVAFPCLNGLLNLMYIIKKNNYVLKKNMYIFHKNMSIFSKENQNPNHPCYDLYIHLWLKVFPYLKLDFRTPSTFLRKISSFFIKIKHIPHKNMYFFSKVNWDPSKPYYDWPIYSFGDPWELTWGILPP